MLDFHLGVNLYIKSERNEKQEQIPTSIDIMGYTKPIAAKSSNHSNAAVNRIEKQY